MGRAIGTRLWFYSHISEELERSSLASVTGLRAELNSEGHGCGRINSQHPTGGRTSENQISYLTRTWRECYEKIRLEEFAEGEVAFLEGRWGVRGVVCPRVGKLRALWDGGGVHWLVKIGRSPGEVISAAFERGGPWRMPSSPRQTCDVDPCGF